jgi:Rhodopirellula transposase DDE domain
VLRARIDGAAEVVLVVRFSRQHGQGTPGKVYVQLDETAYEKGIKISDPQMAAINIQHDPFHGDWNYIIRPTATVITS